MKAPLPLDEDERIQELTEYRILDTDPEDQYDDLVQLASHICGTPIALVSFVDADRQFLKAKIGLKITETPRDVAFCAHAILKPELTVVPDAIDDERFADNPLVTSDPKIRFYAGAPLVSPDGHAMGTLCVLDRVPRTLDASQRQALQVLGRQVVRLLELRRAKNKAEQANTVKGELLEAAARRTGTFRKIAAKSFPEGYCRSTKKRAARMDRRRVCRGHDSHYPCR